jgi:hypothetical protein
MHAADRAYHRGLREARPIVGLDGAPIRQLCSQSSSVTALTLRVDTPCTDISASAATSAFSERW